MKIVRQLLDAKGHEVVTISPTASVLDAIKLMAQKGIGALLVMDGTTLTGIVTERDYARKVILKERSSSETAVTDIMTSDMQTAGIDDTVEYCMNLMTENRIRHIPILEGEKLIGIISIGDLVKAVIADQQEAIEHLANYISG